MHPTYPTPTSPAAPLDAERLRSQLWGSPIGHRVEIHSSLPSTMPVAAALVRRSDLRSGVVVVAEEQTAGRGRYTRSWLAPAGLALLVSIGLKPPHLRLPPSFLPIAAGLATLDAVEACTPELAPLLTLKWPNDLLLGASPTQAAKVAGILVETSLSTLGKPEIAVIGCGINANQGTDELPPTAPFAPLPTSLCLAHGAPIDRTELLIHLCRALSVRLAHTPDTLLAAWRAHLGTLGQQVAVYPHDQSVATVTGLAVDVDSTGALIIQDDQGMRHVVHAGDVSLRSAE
jgi:BirA family biotin operon repressor/biotin-[acetyl-CoA-carboxylase] ligase